MKLWVVAGAAAVALFALPAVAQADVTVTPVCNGTACSSDWYTVNVTVAFSLAGSGFTIVSGCETYQVTSDTDDFAASCIVDSGGGDLGGSKIVHVKRDATPPTATANAAARSPDANGWYNHPVDVGVSGNDNLSGVASCTATTYSGPDSGSASVSGKCRDNAGNVSAPVTLALKYDATAPTVTSSPGRSADSNGWYNHPVDVAFKGTDATSGIDSCSTSTYSGPDGDSTSVSGTCRDAAGNSAGASFGLKYDSTAPKVSASPGRDADSNGWYNHPVDVAFKGTDATSGIDSCSSSTYSGPDDGSASVSGTCQDAAGNAASGSFGLKYDATDPTVTGATAGRAPDANGWYNHSVVVTFAGSDKLSGIASCDAVQYDKPDDPTAKVTGNCHDNAGNVSDASSFALKFDATPPELSDLVASALDGAVAMKWKLSKDVARLTVTRTGGGSAAAKTVYDGKATAALTDKNLSNGVHYSYVVKSIDEAGNAETRQVTAEPSAPLFPLRQEARVHGSVTLHWRPVAHASYYNVQLWFRGVKILSRWPTGPSFHVPRTWSFGGHSYYLRMGRYVWHVWPGLGVRTKHRFGARIGTSAFVVS